MQLAKHGGPLHGLDELTGDGIDDEDVPGGPAQDGDELGGLNDGDAGGAAGQDADDLAARADGGDKGLQEQGEPGAPPLDGPARDEQVDGPAKGGAHAEEGELRGRFGGDLVDGAAVARAGVGRVGLVVDVALHEVEDVEDGDLGEGEGQGDEEAGEEDFDGVHGAEDSGQPGGGGGGGRRRRRGFLGVIVVVDMAVGDAIEAAVIAIGMAVGGNGSILVVLLLLLTDCAVEERRPLVSYICHHLVDLMGILVVQIMSKTKRV